jgi:perosamine synthetase
MNSNDGAIPLSSPDITEAEIAAVTEVLRTPQLSLGPQLPAFERALCERTGARHAIAVNSGTSGLHLSIRAAGIGAGDEVITSPFSFVASSNSVLFEGGVPVFVDIDARSYNIDPERIEAAITPRTRAILPVHVFGRPCAMEEILYLARRYGLEVIEDSCEAIGATRGTWAAGTMGRAGVFAFYPNKQITTGEGGAVMTNDDHVAALCRSLRNQGRGEGSGWLQHERLGYNYRLSDIQCALGSAQLARLDEILEARARVAAWYDQRLAGVDGLVRPELEEPGATVSWFVYVVRLAERFGRAERDALIGALRERGIGANNYFTPIHLQPFYQDRFGFRPGDFPITEGVAERTIALPFFTRLGQAEVDRVCATFTSLLRGVEDRTLAVA